MKKSKLIVLSLIVTLLLVGGILIQFNISAHCDTIDGPVVKAAKDALEKQNVNLILIWVKKEHEKELIRRFNQTLKAREISDEIKELADFSFYETAVRLHREGEGEPYTGLKAAGTDLVPAIPAGDKSVEDGSISEVHSLISDAVEKGLNRRFSELMQKKNYNPNDIDAGRDYVKAYLEYIHFVEELYNAAANPETHSHGDENTEHNRKLNHWKHPFLD